MATIAKLPIGHTETLNATYTVQESDMGREDVTCTATARSKRTEVEGTSPVITMEAVRKALKLTKTVANTPADGEAYAPGEDVEFDIKTENTGNQTLSGVEVTEQTDGVSIVEGDGYTLEEGAAKIATLAPKQFVTVDSVKHVQDADVELEGWTNIAQGKIGEIIQNGVSPIVLFKSNIPQTLDGLEWSKIAKLAEDAKSNPQDYQHLLGVDKGVKVNFMGYGEDTVWISGIGKGDLASGGKAGFFMETEHIIATSAQSDNDKALCTWKDSKVRALCNGGIWNSLPSEMRAVVSPAKVTYNTEAATESNTPATSTVTDNCFIHNYRNVFGADTYGTFGEQLDWYATHNTNEDRVRKQLSNESANGWWLLVAYTWSSRYGFRLVGSIGSGNYSASDGTLGVVPCFLI